MNGRKLLLLCLFLTLSLVGWGQNNKFESRKLQEAASQLSKEVPYANAVYQFAENYLNQLLTLGPEERAWRMKADDFAIEQGGLDRLHLINDETALAMRAKDNRYTVNITTGTYPLIQFSFPMSYQLISQKKLKELEAEFIKELSSFQYQGVKESSVVKKSELKKTAPHLYIKKGEEYYIEAINNDLYYVEEKGKFALAHDPAYVAESICNLLISENSPCDTSLKLVVRQYGFKTDELKLPLKQWINYCKSKGCELYVGIEKMETSGLKASVFAVNDMLKYNHVMNVEIPYSLLDGDKGEVEANITVFIPTHNILALFEEMNMNKKKSTNKGQ